MSIVWHAFVCFVTCDRSSQKLSPSLCSAYKAFPAIYHICQVSNPWVLPVFTALRAAGADSSVCRDAVPGSSDGTSWGPQHLALEGAWTEISTGQMENDPTFPLSHHCSYTAQQIKTSDQHNSYCCLLCSLGKKKKKTQLLISTQVGTNSGWQISRLGQGKDLSPCLILKNSA